MFAGVRTALLSKAPSAAPAGNPNIVDPAGWGTPSNGSISYDGATDKVAIADQAPNGTNIGNTPLVALKASTTYDYSISASTGNMLKVQLRYGGATGTLAATLNNAPGQFTTGAADLGDGKIYLRQNLLATGASSITGLSVKEH